jgi:iron complex transport system substrate-binding protein
VDGNSPANIRVLEEAGIKVYIINPRTVRDALATIRAIGEVCRSADRAKAAAEGLALRIRKVFERTSGLERPVVFLQINIRPIMSVNKNTFHQDVITLAGGINATRDEPLTYPRISIEEVIRINPDVIVISSMERGGEYEKARKEWFNWPGIKAVTGARVHLIDSDLLDRPSPRLVDGIEQMAAILHPGEGR